MKQMYLTLYLTLYLTRSCIVILKDNSLNDTQSKITQQHVVLTKIKSYIRQRDSTSVRFFRNLSLQKDKN
jgi:hypothetical protein